MAAGLSRAGRTATVRPPPCGGKWFTLPGQGLFRTAVILPDPFTLLQVTPELETGGAEQTTLDVAHAVIDAGGSCLVATRGGRMAARLEADGGRLAQMPVQSKNPL